MDAGLPPPSETFPPSLATRYAPLRSLGRGGQGVVVLAEDRELHRKVAVKLVLPSGLEDPLATAPRFLREAKVTAQVRHEAIVEVLDFGEVEEGSLYIVYSFVEGVSWEERLKTGSLPPSLWLPWVRSLAEALDLVHAEGVVHRDLKPANILLRDDAQPVLCDFGLAATPRGETLLTRTGMVLGSPWYMAPEQWLGAPVSGAADQFGLAGCALKSLTHRAPWDGLSLSAIHHCVEARRPVEMGGSVPRPVERVLARAFSWRPEDRFPTTLAFAEALDEALLPPAPIVSTPIEQASGRTPGPTVGPGPLVLAGLCALFLALNVALRAPAPAPPPPPPDVAVVLEEKSVRREALEKAMAPIAEWWVPVHLRARETTNEAVRVLRQPIEDRLDEVMDPRLSMRYQRILDALVAWGAAAAPARPGGHRALSDHDSEFLLRISGQLLIPLLASLTRAIRPSVEDLLRPRKSLPLDVLKALHRDLLTRSVAAAESMRAPAGVPPPEFLYLEGFFRNFSEVPPVDIEDVHRVLEATEQVLRRKSQDGPTAQMRISLLSHRYVFLQKARDIPCEARAASLAEARARLLGEARLLADPLRLDVGGSCLTEAFLLSARCPERSADAAATFDHAVAVMEGPMLRDPEDYGRWITEIREQRLLTPVQDRPDLQRMLAEVDRLEGLATGADAP